MAEATQFDHDQIGHLLADHLLEVPQYQRSYSWSQINVEEYLRDLEAARRRSVSYFMGTLVFAHPEKGGNRRTIVDGQQRLATTAILFIAIRDLLKNFGRIRQATEIQSRYLQGYVLADNADVERLLLNPKDNDSLDALLNGRSEQLSPQDPLRICYEACVKHLATLAPTRSGVKRLLDVAEQLENGVQVLVAVATDLAEAFVIFETLNDRGADLTTADLLKNYLFSQAGRSGFRSVETKWIQLEANMPKPEDLVQFIRYEYISRHGATSTRKLYRLIQDELKGPADVKEYLRQLQEAQEIYLALRDPSNEYWASASEEVHDALMAFRRFGFESSFPLLIAAFVNWTRRDALKLLVKVAKWSVRAQFAGRIGARQSEEAFGDAAEAVSSGEAKNQVDVRGHLKGLIPSNPEFETFFANYGPLQVSRAKYLLAMLEKAAASKEHRAVTPLDWFSQGVTIEHILSISESHGNDEAAAVVDRIGNLALLEKRMNQGLGSKPFTVKRVVYADSSFQLTSRLSDRDAWSVDSVAERARDLARLAVVAWPSV